jgi:hypothetical protein
MPRQEWETLSPEDRADWREEDVTRAAIAAVERLVVRRLETIVALAPSAEVAAIRHAAGRLQGVRDVLNLLKGSSQNEPS